MSTKERVSLGFGSELDDFDPNSWTAKAPQPKRTAEKPTPEAAKKAAEAAGFRSREPAPSKAHARPQRRRRTGRNVQFNIKTRQETIEAFCAIADAKGWGLGETFEFATELLERETRGGKA